MTIAFLIYEYAHEKAPVYGGIGTYFKTMAHELHKKGITVHVFLYNPDFDFESFTDGAVKITVLKNYFKSHFLQRKLKKRAYKKRNKKQYYKYISLEHKYIAKQFLKFIAHKNIDIIQTHDYLGIISHLKTPIPKVIRCSGSTVLLKNYFNYKFDDIIYSTRKNLEQQAFDTADYIIGVSKFTANSTQKLFNTNTIKVINNGINVSQFTNTAKEIPFSIFYFGTVRKTKGIDVIARVFNAIIKKEPKATLHIIGRGEEYWDRLLLNILSKEAKNNSKYYGPVVRDKMISLIQKASVFIFPTHGENFPFTFIEAMVLEKPIVVSNIEVSKEIITHKKDSFIAKNEHEYIEYILDIFEDENKRKCIGKNAKDKVLNNFTLDHMVENTINFYKKILN